ncbi:FAD-binding oxidoreductase [Abyssibius alkaniclasticus]|uniref:NAD(P)/FAD-dependent oxidoreductase n=1 Tax=Abyssibius alkaniclasticus TaxID=2881234 RepID=UPI0023633418|nr:FAD-dependent oxidoreductase [Abyssibius alkaniclasticus]UPH71893.1 FAD-binding oxidoreductase [Abyssibius alkaniclasticus]
MGQTSDVIVVGAGVFGLTAALAFARAGQNVLLLERAASPGAGASGGLVGALSPYMPENWNIRKAAQFRALRAAPAYWAGVEALGGRSSGYGQTGRIVPLTTARAAELAPQRAGFAAELWEGAGLWLVRSAMPDWLNPAAAPYGIVQDTLSARIDPALACAAVLAAFRASGGRFAANTHVQAVQSGRVETASGILTAPLIILATGVANWPGMAPMRGVKGQAALLAGGLPPSTPSLYADGIYIIAHASGRVAIGATSEEDFDDAHSTDGQLDTVLQRAFALVPALHAQPIVARWAGVRPRAPRPEPMLGWVQPGVLAATGGFRTGFALAPLIADALVAMARGDRPDIPPHYHMEDHMRPR